MSLNQEKGTIKALECLRKSTTNFRLKTRLLYLIIKDDIRDKILESLAQLLDISISSIGRWKTTYIEEYLSKLLTISIGGKRREVVIPDIHKVLG